MGVILGPGFGREFVKDAAEALAKGATDAAEALAKGAIGATDAAKEFGNAVEAFSRAVQDTVQTVCTMATVIIIVGMVVAFLLLLDQTANRGR